MKFSAAAVVLAFASSTFAVSVTDLPSCSLSCFAAAIANTTCGATDYVCQCTTGRSVIESIVTPCVEKTCSESDQATTLSVSEEICTAALASASATSSGASATGSSTTSSSTTTATSASVASRQAIGLLGLAGSIVIGVWAL